MSAALCILHFAIANSVGLKSYILVAASQQCVHESEVVCQFCYTTLQVP